MPKKIICDNYRVEVLPDKPWLFGCKTDEETHKAWINVCKRLEEEIKRHVDHGGTSIEYDDTPVCEYCGYAWTEKSDEFNGGCCDKDLEHEPKEERENEQNN